jgi:predicted O-linked N-acetylglucosamine transferase (SPINDLY family)
MNNIDNELKELISLVKKKIFLKARLLVEDLIIKSPDVAILENISGIIFLSHLDYDKAIIAFKKAIKKDANFFHAYYNLGITFSKKKDYQHAKINFQNAINLNVNYLEAYIELSQTLIILGEYQESIDLLKKYSLTTTDNYYVYNNLGLAHLRMKNIKEAIIFFNKAISLNLDFFEAYNNLTLAYIECKEYSAALEISNIAQKLRPNFIQSYLNRSIIFNKTQSYVESFNSAKKALEIDHLNSKALSLLLLSSINTLRHDEALDCYSKINFGSSDHDTIKSSIFSSLYLENFDQQKYFSIIQEYKSLFLKLDIKDFIFNKNKNKKLKVGFLSGDFKEHALMSCLSSFFEELNKRDDIETYAYSNTLVHDKITSELKSSFFQWKDVSKISDIHLINLIRKDNLDFLIDLSGFTDGSRLPIFNYRSAKYQLSWLGYLSSTAMDNMDYILSDSNISPQSEKNPFKEKIARLPNIWTPFSKINENIEIVEPPVKKNGYITFGCFNQLSKINYNVIEVWSKILNKVPNSKLFLKAYQFADLKVQNRLKELFYRHSVFGNQLILEPQEKKRDLLLKCYNKIDIALDPFPYNGMTTSLECSWMCVPILTKFGKNFVSRTGASINTHLNLKDWICYNDSDYINKAIKFSKDVDNLQEIKYYLKKNRETFSVFSSTKFVDDFIFLLKDILNN